MEKIMNTKADQAVLSFRSELNCAQAVLTAYAEELHFDRNLALGISSGFGGGMGRLQETCGAVTGSFMVLGVYNSRKHPDNTARKEATYQMIQAFDVKFKSIHGATDCRSLLNCDLRTEEGKRFAEENNLHGTVCEKCIRDSVAIVQELINE